MCGIDHLAAGATMFIAAASGCVGVGASQMELNTTFVDKENYPLLRTTGRVFFKTVQSTAAVLSFTLLGSLTISSVPVAGALLFAGVVAIGMPTANALVEHYSKNETIKNLTRQMDHGISIFAKMTNVATATLLAFAAYGSTSAVLVGLGATAIGIAAYCKN